MAEIKARIFICCMAVVFCMGYGQAAPSMQGSTGMIDTPTADVLREGQFSAAYYHLSEYQGWVLDIPLDEKIEFGAVLHDVSGKGHQVAINLKYAVKPEHIFTPGIAVGVDDLGGRTERTAYLVMSKGLPQGFRVHVGVGNGRYGGLFYSLEKKLLSSVVAGTFPDTSLLVEYDGRRMNYGIRTTLGAGLQMQAGQRDKETYFGVMYSFY